MTDSETNARPSLSDRWDIERVVGAGGYGIVYAAFDRTLGERVALKLLRNVDGYGLASFRREFRSLAEVDHPNLVSLYEFAHEGDRWFFTMQLVDGVEITEYLRRQSHDGCVNYTLLRSTFAQLAIAVEALHRAGKLHRDLKPSNILVDHAGHVTVLDFGLVKDTRMSAHTTSHQVVGTVAYMAPEQAAGADTTEASDWYSFGTVLYEALCGTLPFHGDHVDVFTAKQLRDPEPPVARVPLMPVDLNDLCVGLLRRDAAQRPGATEILGLLGAAAPQGEARSVFVGRERELALLDDAFDEASRGSITTVYVHGVSGIGKTSLVQHWLGRRAGADVSIFDARCYERELMPYKAFDAIADSLAHGLSRLPHSTSAESRQNAIDALARIFSSLQALLSPVTALSFRATPPDPQEVRRRSLVAFEEILEWWSADRPLILFIDDFQWGDRESATLLMHLMRCARRIRLLLIISFREEDRETSDCLQMLAAADASSGVRQVDVGPLTVRTSRALVHALLASGDNVNDAGETSIAVESMGNPLFIWELTRYSTSGVGDPKTPSFSQAITARVNDISPVEHRLLIAVAVAAHPIPEHVALRAANALGSRSAVVALRSARLLRIVGAAGDRIATFHDRIREEVVRGLTVDQLRAEHRRLADAMEACGDGTPETLAAHCLAAGDIVRASTYTARAAAQAANALAFDHAADLYRQALELMTRHPGIESRSIGPDLVRVEFAEALANAGRGAEAADAFLAAAEHATGGSRLEFRRRAAEQLLHSGHIDRGLAVLRSVLSSVGLTFPEPTGWLLLQLLFRRVLVRLRGTQWHERRAEDLATDVLLRIDACASAATGLALVDIARGTLVQTTNYLLSMKAGEPCRVSRALAMEAAYASTQGTRAQARTTALSEMAITLATRIDHPGALALAKAMAAGCAWNMGAWRTCRDAAEAASEVIRDRCRGVTWERDTANIFYAEGLRWMGEWRAMQHVLPALLDDARSRGDLYAEAILQMHCGSCAALAHNDPDAARQGLRILSRWSNASFHVEHLVELHNQVEIALYCDQPAVAIDHINRKWPALSKSLLLRVQTLGIQMYSLRARAAVASAAVASASDSARASWLRDAEAAMKRIRHYRAEWGDMLADLVEAALWHLKGDEQRAATVLARAERASGAADMKLHAIAARRAGAVIRGDVTTTEACDRDMASEDIHLPAALARVITPGVAVRRVVSV